MTTGPAIPPPAKPLDTINKVPTVWAAVIAAVATVAAIPAVQQAVIGVFTHPNPQSIGAAVGAAVTGALLYFAKPVGVS